MSTRGRKIKAAAAKNTIIADVNVDDAVGTASKVIKRPSFISQSTYSRPRRTKKTKTRAKLEVLRNSVPGRNSSTKGMTETPMEYIDTEGNVPKSSNAGKKHDLTASIEGTLLADSTPEGMSLAKPTESETHSNSLPKLGIASTRRSRRKGLNGVSAKEWLQTRSGERKSQEMSAERSQTDNLGLDRKRKAVSITATTTSQKKVRTALKAKTETGESAVLHQDNQGPTRSQDQSQVSQISQVSPVGDSPLLSPPRNQILPDFAPLQPKKLLLQTNEVLDATQSQAPHEHEDMQATQIMAASESIREDTWKDEEDIHLIPTVVAEEDSMSPTGVSPPLSPAYQELWQNELNARLSQEGFTQQFQCTQDEVDMTRTTYAKGYDINDPLCALGEGSNNSTNNTNNDNSSTDNNTIHTDRTCAFEIAPNELQRLEEVGRGHYGNVFRGMWRGGTPVAIKHLSAYDKLLLKDHSSMDAKQKASLERSLRNVMIAFRREMDMLSALRHPNVLLWLGAVVQPPELMLVSEWMPKGSLQVILHGPTYVVMENARRLQIALDTACGMQYLHHHTPPIVHRDLKSANVLITDSFRAKVGDFGLARFMHTTATKRVSLLDVTIQAPEVLSSDRQSYTRKSDVFAFGLLLWEIHCRRILYDGLPPSTVADYVQYGQLRPTIPTDCHHLYAQLMSACWAQDPLDRPNFDSVCVYVCIYFLCMCMCVCVCMMYIV